MTLCGGRRSEPCAIKTSCGGPGGLGSGGHWDKRKDSYDGLAMLRLRYGASERVRTVGGRSMVDETAMVSGERGELEMAVGSFSLLSLALATANYNSRDSPDKY